MSRGGGQKSHDLYLRGRILRLQIHFPLNLKSEVASHIQHIPIRPMYYKDASVRSVHILISVFIVCVEYLVQKVKTNIVFNFCMVPIT